MPGAGPSNASSTTMAPPSLRTIQKSLISQPVFVYVPLSAFVAFFALRTSPSFTALILLLATVRLFVTTVACRERAHIKMFFMVTALSISMAFANIAPSFSALPAHISSAIICLLFLTTLTCITSVVTIYLDTRYRGGMRTPWDTPHALPNDLADRTFHIIVS